MAKKGLRTHKNASIVTQTKLAFEDYQTASGICATCTMCGQCEVGLKSKTGQTLFPGPFGLMQFGAEKILPNLEDLQLVPELYGENILFREASTESIIGSFKASVPVVVAAMGSTKVAHVRGEALAAGAAKAGIPMAIGENMLITHGKEGLKKRMQPYLDNYDGKHGALVIQGNGVDQKMGIFETGKELGAHAIELKLGQGAKQGLGGEVRFEGDETAEKYRQVGYHIVKNPDGTYQRHSPPGAISDELIRDALIKYSELDLPIWAKIAVGKGILGVMNTFEEVKREQGIKFECLTVDGAGGGTGMSPWLIMEESGVPSASLFKIMKEKMSYDVLLAGGFNTGFDMAKGMMLGANGIAMGRPFLIAANVIKDNPPQGVVNFVEALKEELQMICATQKVTDVKQLIGKKEALIALSHDAEKMFGITQDPADVL